MKRTTVVLTDQLATLLELERRRQNLSAAGVVRRALEAYLLGDATGTERLPFVSLGRSGQRDTARRIDEILAGEWTVDRDRDR